MSAQAESTSPEDGPAATSLGATSLAATKSLEPGLYLVATPIGNLEDITLRALRVLRSATRIACEDTRVTRKLLNRYDIHTPVTSCHEHNERARTTELIAEIQAGGSIAVVTDAGMPGISDPGAILAQAAVEAGVPVIPIPGPNAAIAAVAASGVHAERFLFVGFLPPKAGARQHALADLAGLPPAALVFYEAPHRVLDTLADLEQVFGAKARIAVARELTKIHEEFLRGTISEVRAALQQRDRILGEFVLVLQPGQQAPPEHGRNTSASLASRLDELMQQEGLDRKAALKRAARERGLSRSEAYREVLRQQAAADPTKRE